MKKIYMILAAITLLSMSLNAQDICKPRTKAKSSKKVENVQTMKKASLPKAKIPTLNQLLSGIEGMSSVLQAGSHTDGAASSNGSWRAPLKINADEYTMGPFEGDNVGSTALGYYNAYPDPQWITVTTELTRSEFENHIGDEIVGFRFALGGNTTRVHEVSDFVVIPRTASGLDNNNAYDWNLANLNGATTAYSYGDITITVSNWYVEFSDITVYDANGQVLEHWDANSTDTYEYTFSGETDPSTCYNLPTDWTKTTGHFIQEGSGTSADPYTAYLNSGSSTSGSITIPGSLLTCATSTIRVVCTSWLNGGTGTLSVNGIGTSGSLSSTSLAPFEWTIQSTGTTTPNYVELNGGYTGDGGNWHEFYLPEPIVFNPASDVQALRMGYIVRQYPASEETHYRFPIAINPESTSHDHYVYRYGSTGSSGTAPIGNGATTNNYLPVYGNYQDYGYKNQMIYSASQLGLSSGTQITSLTFYPGSYGIPFYGSTIYVSLGNTSTSDFSSSSSYLTGLTQVASMSITSANSSATEMTFTFDQPFNYTGQNLVVEVKCAGYRNDGTSGQYSSSNFLGDTQSTSVSLHSYGSSAADATTGTRYSFLPKATFGYSGTYAQQWYQVDYSEYGDLTVQLIMKSSLPKTDPPVITADTTATYVTITATATDPNAAVSMTIDGQTYTGTGTATATFPRGNTDSSVNVSATATETGLQESNPATATIGIPALPVTPTPVITTNETATEMVVTATAASPTDTVTLVVNGQTYTGLGEVSTTIPRGTDDQSYTATATAHRPDYQPSEEASATFTVHEAGRSPMPTITMTDNGDGTYTITVTGTGEVAVYIDDAEHGGTSGDPILTGEGSVSFTVEQHSQPMSITVQATNQETGLAISRTAEETYNIPAMTIGDDFQELVPQPANASTPIDMKSLMFVDRFGVVIPNENNHPRQYDYYLQETQVRQRTSNSVEVPVKHTGSDGLGFYSLNQIDNDTVRTLKMDVRNAATDIPLEADPKVYYYTVQRSTAAYPDQADRKWLGVLQRTSDGYYYENLSTAYDYGADPYPGGQHHIHLDMDTILGEYNDYLMYVPVVWTMGFDRVLYETDHEHNSYGAPKWKTGVGDVAINMVDVELQTNSASVTWDDNGKTSMYLMTLDATGVMPTVNTMPYEPYMFRVFVESKNGKLRNWKWVPEDTVHQPHTGSHFEAAPGTTTGPICVWSEYVKDSENVTINGNEIYFVKEKVAEYDTTGHWISPGMVNILFAALDDMDTYEDTNGNEFIIENDLKIYVRFYYIVKGSADDHTPVVHGQRPRGEGDDPAGYGSESPGTPPSPSTGVKEVQYYGDVVSMTYYNVQGMSSDKPFDGINIVVIRYSNGTSRTFKVVR